MRRAGCPFAVVFDSPADGAELAPQVEAAARTGQLVVVIVAELCATAKALLHQAGALLVLGLAMIELEDAGLALGSPLLTLLREVRRHQAADRAEAGVH